MGRSKNLKINYFNSKFISDDWNTIKQYKDED